MGFGMLSENLCNLRTFPDHTRVANQETSGNEVEYVQSGRRQKALNHWTPTSENAEATITLTMDRVRGFDFIGLDRGHNLDGESFRVTGDLTIRDVTREVVLEGEFEGQIQDPWGKDRAAFSASVEISRKEFNVRWNQVLEAGGVTVGDKVKVSLQIEAVREG